MGTLDNPADDSRLQSILNHAEAHRHAALHLYRAVLGHPRASAPVRLAAKHALQACFRVVIFSAPIAALLWPLFAAACEAVDAVDHNVARTVFRHLESRQGMANIVTAWKVCETAWRRADAGDSDLDWRDVARDMSLEVMFG